MFGAIAALISLGSIGCGRPSRTPDEAKEGLSSSDPKIRRDCAEDLREDGRVPADAVPRLYAAIDKESDPDAYGAEMISLGASGDSGAKPYICGHKGGPAMNDSRAAHWQSKALGEWVHKNPGEGGCAMSDIEEVPRNQGPSETKAKPVKPPANIFAPGM